MQAGPDAPKPSPQPPCFGTLAMLCYNDRERGTAQTPDYSEAFDTPDGTPPPP